MSDTRQFLKPGEGRTVRRQDTGEVWPADGLLVETSQFVRRRIADGDLVAATPARTATTARSEAEKQGSSK